MNIKLVVILSFVMICIAASAQFKSVFGSVSTSWNQYFIGTNSRFTDSLFVTGDTIINDKNYKIVGWRNGESGGIVMKQYYLYETQDHSKVYLYFPESQYPNMLKREFLVMDLNLKVNDSFQLMNGYSTDVLESTSVDSVYFDAQNRKHVRFNSVFERPSQYQDEKFEFIEGVGTTIGLFYQSMAFYTGFEHNYILCTHHNDTVNYYGKKSGGQCNYFSTNIRETIEDRNIVVEMNQKNKILNIKDVEENGELFLIDIYNENGNLVRRINHVMLPASIPMNAPGKGIYLVKCSSEKKVLNKKIVVLY